MQKTNETKQVNPGGMKHPGREQWMAFLYSETDREEKGRMAAHLRECADCRAEVDRWQNAMGALNQYQLAPVRKQSASVRGPLLKWAAAAVVVLATGFCGGWIGSHSATDAAGIRASLKSELRAEMLAELKQQRQEFEDDKQATEQKQAEENRLILTTLGKLNADRLADYTSLHKELETMAVLTQDGLQQQQQQIVTLANYTQADAKLPEHP